MANHTRRTFLTVSGATIGGIFAASSTVAAQESTERFIVKLQGGRVPNAEVLYDLSEIGYAVVKGSESALKEDGAVEGLAPDISYDASDPAAESVTPDSGAETVDDTYYPYQWDKQALNAPMAHETTTGDGSRIAIIDSGIDASHPDLEENVNLELSKNFTNDDLGAGVPGGGDHGTHVAGIAAASNDGSTGVVGTAPDAELVDFRVFSTADEDSGSFSYVVAAMLEAARTNCDVANLSLGAYPVSRKELGSFYGSFLNQAMTYVNKEGTLLVISAGNDGVNLQNDNGQQVDIDGDGELETLEGGHWISLPNEGAQALSVSATGPIGFGSALVGDESLEEPPETPAFYTNYGTSAVTLGAPGGNADLSMTDPINGIPAYAYDLVFSTLPVVDGEPQYGWKAGTSMAAPNVAGAAALVKATNPDYDANRVESALKRAADVPEEFDKEYYGSGFLNIVDAL
ncbi:S8 family serine peptidase [Halomarina salina]|uniref:S8 family serine peptidase n=1 Tax=Halomarina salina TaxID=1872699 RepID=A0ABD5RTL1_9EURY|nr:S8 family serine peptidase [Halomarina salina]